MYDSPEILVGETLEYIDLGDNEILLTTKSGRKFRVYHRQDCCESVWLENVEGDFKNLVGKVVIGVDTEINPEDDPIFTMRGPSYDSRTDTKLTFKVDGNTVITRWIGESNGYYSEYVDFDEL